MRKIKTFLLLVVFCSNINYSYADTTDSSIDRVRKDRGLQNLCSIEELLKKKVAFGTYHTVGYVAKIYECPPCPESAQCKPCMRENIVISHDEKRLGGYDLGPKDLIVFVDDTRSFKLGQKYLFLIKILDAKTTDHPINNVQLIYSEILK